MKKAISRIVDGRRETVVVDIEGDEKAAIEAEHLRLQTVPASAIKAEARRRILARYPDWKQANMTARGVELLRKGEANWSQEELAEADAIHAAWDWVKSVRSASDGIEAASPIPEDFRDDKHWPE